MPDESFEAVTAAEVKRGAVAVASGLVGSLSSLGLMATSAWLIATSSLKPPILTLTVAIAAVRGLALLRGLGRYGERLKSHDLALHLLVRVRKWVYGQLEKLVPGALGDETNGRVLSRLVADVDATQDLVVRLLIPVLVALLTAGASVMLSWLLLPEAGEVLAISLLVGGIGIPWVVSRLVVRSSKQAQIYKSEAVALVADSVEGASEIVALGALPKALASVAQTDAKLSRANWFTALAKGSLDGLSDLISGISVLGVTVIAAVAIKAHHVISPVVGVVLVFVAMAAFDSLSGLGQAFVSSGAIMEAVRRVKKVGDAMTLVRETKNSDQLAVSSRIEFESVTVGYPTNLQPVLREISLRIEPGEKVALLGPSGSGKSTFCLALLGFLPILDGRITIGASDVSEEHSSRLIAWAPQESHIFSASVAANLKIVNPEVSDSEVEELLRELGLGLWLSKLPDGLATGLGRNGVELSGGEAKRFGVARALLSDRPVLLLDEPTAELDRASARLVLKTVLEHSRTKSLIWITHKPEELRFFDRTIVLG
jgi:thiol reductant ABC exporter CydC subunit